MTSRRLPAVKTLVLKVGTGVLVGAGAAPDRATAARLVGAAIDAKRAGRQVILVSSGAIGLGLRGLGLRRRPATLPELQAAAAVGQGLLMTMYSELCAGRGFSAAQILLTAEDVHDRRRYLNIQNTLGALERLPVLPVINENDSVSVDEIKFGDNDRLSALVATLVRADLLVIFSTVDGLFTADPTRDAGAELVRRVEDGARVEAAATTSALGTGGMASKLAAARIAARGGAHVVIANGRTASLRDILDGREVGTHVVAHARRLPSRKSWILFSAREKGAVVIDGGGERAIVHHGRSLLPSGILSVAGEFGEGDAILIRNEDRRGIAKGLSNYSSRDLARIKGRRSAEIREILGGPCYEEVVHRDHLVLL